MPFRPFGRHIQTVWRKHNDGGQECPPDGTHCSEFTGFLAFFICRLETQVVSWRGTFQRLDAGRVFTDNRISPRSWPITSPPLA